ncbi:hypothetical protein ACU4GD_40530 [Cupriavidus basilensis]
MSAVRRLAASPRFLLTPLAAIAPGRLRERRRIRHAARAGVLEVGADRAGQGPVGPPQAVQAVPGGTAYLWTEEVPPARAPGSGPRDARAPTSPEPLQTPGQVPAPPDRRPQRHGHRRRLVRQRLLPHHGRAAAARWSGTAPAAEQRRARGALRSGALNRTAVQPNMHHGYPAAPASMCILLL